MENTKTNTSTAKEFVTAQQAKEIAKSSNFIRKFLNKAIRQAAGCNESRTSFSFWNIDPTVKKDTIAFLISLGYTIKFEDNSEDDIWIIW
jgi:hypothetical protein